LGRNTVFGCTTRSGEETSIKKKVKRKEGGGENKITCLVKKHPYCPFAPRTRDRGRGMRERKGKRNINQGEIQARPSLKTNKWEKQKGKTDINVG